MFSLIDWLTGCRITKNLYEPLPFVYIFFICLSGRLILQPDFDSKYQKWSKIMADIPPLQILILGRPLWCFIKGIAFLAP